MDLLRMLAEAIFGGEQEERRRPQPAQAKGPSLDNRITNQMVQQGRLPQSQAEVYPQQRLAPPLEMRQYAQPQSAAPRPHGQAAMNTALPGGIVPDRPTIQPRVNTSLPGGITPPRPSTGHAFRTTIPGVPLNPNPFQPSGFRMFEDRSFSGDPRDFIANNPGYTFYEDQTFSTPYENLTRRLPRF